MANPESIEYNGRVYSSWDDLPPEARELIHSATPNSTTTSYEVNGTTYESLEDVPAHLRPHLERAATDLAPGESVTERVEGGPAPFAPVRQQTAAPEQSRPGWWQRLLGRG